MKALIFAAGLGTRLKPLTDTVPKALVPLAGKPLLQWQVERLRDAGIRDIVVNVHHFPDMIIDAIAQADGWGCRIQVSDERDLLLNTGGGLRKAQEMLIDANRPDEPILACNVDILSNIDIPLLLSTYAREQAENANTMGLLVVSQRQTQRYLLFDQTKRLVGWTNKATGEYRPASLAQRNDKSAWEALAFSGMQVLKPTVFDCMQTVVADKGQVFSLIDFYLSACDQYTFKAYIPKDYKMMDVGKIEQVQEAELFAQSIK